MAVPAGSPFDGSLKSVQSNLTREQVRVLAQLLKDIKNG